MNEIVLEKAKKIKLLLMDCDGVLTDGKLYYSASGEELKVFHVRDGQGLVLWHKAGFESGIITGRKSEILSQRANELNIKYIIQGSDDKAEALKEIMLRANVNRDEVAFIGDDIVDSIVFGKVGFSVAVNDAVSSVFDNCDYITEKKGGFGAVREVINLILGAKSKK